jgi:hypothetical protein
LNLRSRLFPSLRLFRQCLMSVAGQGLLLPETDLI